LLLVWLVCHNEGFPILLNEDDFYGLPLLLLCQSETVQSRERLFFPVLEGIFFRRWFSMDRSHIPAEQDGV
jgi:hypothetical protein